MAAPGHYRPDPAYCRLVKPSNLSTSLIYSPTVLDLDVLGCAGLDSIRLWWAVLGSGGLGWALVGYTGQYCSIA